MYKLTTLAAFFLLIGSSYALWTFAAINNNSGFDILVDGVAYSSASRALVRGDAMITVGNSDVGRIVTFQFTDVAWFCTNWWCTWSVQIDSISGPIVSSNYFQYGGGGHLTFTINPDFSASWDGFVLPAPICQGRGTLNGGICDCDVGFAHLNSATDCLRKVTCNSVTLDPTSFVPPLTLTSAHFTNNKVVLTIVGDWVQNRNNFAISFANGVDAGCKFPGVNWQQTLSSDGTGACSDVFSGVIPWSMNNVCGFTADNSDANYLVYRASIVVSYYDVIGTVKGKSIMHTSSNSFNIAVRFPKAVTVTSTLQAFTPVNLEVALMQQVYNPVTNCGTLVHTLAAGLQWPLSIEMVGVTLPAGLSLDGAVVLTDSNCPATSGTVCRQTISWRVNPNSQCYLTGDHVVAVSFKCRGDPSQCPLDASTNSGQVNVNVVSEDRCGSVVGDVTLTGQLKSFHDEARTTEKTSFLLTQTAYFRAAVSSPDATIIGASVASVSVTDGVASYVLFSNNVAAVAPTNFVATSGVSSADFQFELVPTVFNVAVDQNAPFTVNSIIKVSFQSNSGTKRTVEYAFSTTSEANTGVSADVEIQGGSKLNSSDAPRLVGISAALVVLLVALLA